MGRLYYNENLYFTKYCEVSLKKLILVAVLALTGCDNVFPLLSGGKPFGPEDIDKMCADLGGKINKDTIQINVSNNVMTSSLGVSFECDLTERNQVKSDLQNH